MITTRCTDGIIFVVDSSQPESLEEARVELWRTMRWPTSPIRELCQEALYISLRYQDNKDIPLLVLANKQDLPSALGGPDVSQVIAFSCTTFFSSQQGNIFPKNQALGLGECGLCTLVAVEPACSVTGEGLDQVSVDPWPLIHCC